MLNLGNNRINATLTPEKMEEVKSAIQGIIDGLPFLIGLTADERKKFTGIDVANKVFVEDVLQTATNNPDLVPGYVSVADMQADLTLFEQLDEISGLLAGLSRRIEDSRTMAGSEAYQAALQLYNAFGNASDAGVAGVQVTVNSLKKRFTGGGSGVKSFEPPPPPDQQ